MSAQNQQADDHQPFCHWPWEEEPVNPADYARSLRSLARFLETTEVSRLQTIEDLSAVASLVGHDIRIISIVKGKEIEKQPAWLEPEASDRLWSAEREYVFRKLLRDQEIVVKVSGGHICLTKKRRIGWQGYQREELRVRLPVDRDISIGERPNVDEQSIYAIDLREGRRRESPPVREPANPAIQQGFARVLKDAVRDLVAVL